MKRNPLLIVIIILVILIGLYLAGNKFLNSNITQETSEPTNQVTNSIMLVNDLDTPIKNISDLEYHPGAKGYYVEPEEEGNYPGIVMIHENRGLRPEIIEMANVLAREGYKVLAVDLYKGQVVETQEEARNISGNFNQEEGLINLRSAVTYLRQQGAEKIASLGWCFGGRQSIELSISGEELDATVVYYGGNMASTEDLLRPINWPVLGIFGDQDQAIPVEKVREFETSLNNLGVENEIYIYPGVGHAFANPSGMNYAPEATKDAWEKTIIFLDKQLKI